MDKREQIKKWFNAKEMTSAHYMGIAIFVIMGLFLIKEGMVEFGLIGIGFFGGGGLIVYIKTKDLVSESELDLWLEQDIQTIIKIRPLVKLGVSKEDLVAETLLVVGPVYWNVSGFDSKDILMKKGKDGFNRFSIWNVQVFMFTENYLCSYKCQYNWIKNTYINESTNEFFYKDVVSVKTDTISSSYTLKDDTRANSPFQGPTVVHSEAFQLKLSGDEITVILNDPRLNTSSVILSKADKAVQSIRVMLRDKKK